MGAYLLKRILLMIPTLFGIMLINFLIIQAAPGGPVEQTLAKLQGLDSDVQSRLGNAQIETRVETRSEFQYRGAQGLAAARRTMEQQAPPRRHAETLETPA